MMLVVSLMLDFQHELSQTLDPAPRSPHHLGCPRIKTLRLALKIRNQKLLCITFLLTIFTKYIVFHATKLNLGLETI